MAGTAVLGRLTWRVSTVASVRDETATARTIALKVPGWPGHHAGQHVDVRLTAADGYSAQRSYSIASAPDGDHLELTVQRLPDGEVSPYLAQVLAAGDLLELRGPIGGWFAWEPGPAPVLLVAGGSGVVPLMAMIRTRAATGTHSPFRLVYSVRGPDDALYAAELAERQRVDDGLGVGYVYTRSTPAGWPVPPGRIGAGALTAPGWAPDRNPAVFVCGPTGFVEATANLLVNAGHEPRTIKTERFGPSGGQS
ncbi:MAG TPA: ferredoxin reductase [Streptosporangiaceae bacterium]|nr:ferredoxin reductase [Streptosporangiaceae bacterium]